MTLNNSLILPNQLEAAQAISSFDVEITARLLSWIQLGFHWTFIDEDSVFTVRTSGLSDINDIKTVNLI